MAARKGKWERFRMLCRELLEQGIKPTPMELHKRQGDDKFVTLYHPHTKSGPALYNGSLVRIRREEFERAGWQVGKNGRWEKPE